MCLLLLVLLWMVFKFLNTMMKLLLLSNDTFSGYCLWWSSVSVCRWLLYQEKVVVRWWKGLWRWFWWRFYDVQCVEWNYLNSVFVISYYLTFFSENRQIACNSNEFKCESDYKCIPNHWRCDNKEDCNDGSDERSCDELSGRCAKLLHYFFFH